MLILLGTSTLAAALVPTPAPREDTTATTSPRTTPVPTGGELITVKLDADARRPRTVRAALGDQIAITVRSRRPAQIQIERLGLLSDVLPLSPARFNVFASQPGRFEITQVEPRREIGVLYVRAKANR